MSEHRIQKTELRADTSKFMEGLRRATQLLEMLKSDKKRKWQGVDGSRRNNLKALEVIRKCSQS